MRKKDIFITILVGIFTALIWIKVFIWLGTFDVLGLDYAVWSLIVIVPIIYVIGLCLGVWLSRRWSFFESFAKYAMIGFFNAGMDFAVFNLLMFLTKIEKGPFISFFKTVSFAVAVTNSYFWNKYWAFEAGSSTKKKSTEFAKFIIVNIMGAFLNIGITSVIIFTIEPRFGFSQLAWNNIAVVIATAFALIWNFIGFRLIVFKTIEIRRGQETQKQAEN